MKKKIERVQVRQGDVFAIEAAPVEESALEPAKDPRGLVLAEGETSGHHHAIFGNGSRLYNFRDGGQLARFVEVGEAGASMRVVGGGSGGVDRHTPIGLGTGRYLTTVQRSWTAEDEARSRQVSD